MCISDNRGKSFVLSATDSALLVHYWSVSNYGDNCYVKRYSTQGGHRKSVYLHREILQPAAGLVVHHKDGNGTNNCRCNLEIITDAENKSTKNRVRSSSNTGHFGIHRDSGGAYVISCHYQSIKTPDLEEAIQWRNILKNDPTQFDTFRKLTKRRQSRQGKTNNKNVWKYKKALEMIKQGHSISSISRQLGVKRDTIYRWREKGGLACCD